MSPTHNNNSFSEVVFQDWQQLILLNIDGEGHIHEVHGASRALLGYMSHEMIGWHYGRLFNITDQSSQLPSAHCVLACAHGEYRARTLWRNNKGENVAFELLYKRVSENVGQSVNAPLIVMAMPALTGEETLTNQRNSADHKIENSSDNKSLRAVNHQMRSPLTVMTLSTNLLKDYGEKMTPAERNEEIIQIQEAIAACHKILDQATGNANVVLPKAAEETKKAQV